MRHLLENLDGVEDQQFPRDFMGTLVNGKNFCYVGTTKNVFFPSLWDGLVLGVIYLTFQYDQGQKVAKADCKECPILEIGHHTAKKTEVLVHKRQRNPQKKIG